MYVVYLLDMLNKHKDVHFVWDCRKTLTVQRKKCSSLSHNQSESFCILNNRECKTGLINRKINVFDQFSAESVEF